MDTNVVRIFDRVFGYELEAQSDEAWKFAEKVLPEDDARRFNLGLLDFGSEVCSARNPSCYRCPMSEFCEYFSTLDDA